LTGGNCGVSSLILVGAFGAIPWLFSSQRRKGRQEEEKGRKGFLKKLPAEDFSAWHRVSGTTPCPVNY